MEFKKLFEPIRMRKLELKNRLILSGLTLNYGGYDGSVTDRLINFYVERARGGVGLIETGICAVEARGKWFPNMLGLYDDYLIPGYKRLVEAVHGNGTRICIQIDHVGRRASAQIMGTQPVSASPIPSPLPYRELPRELSVKEIRGIVEAYGQAAGRAREAGADAVSFLACMGYLIAQFLSPLTNERRDEYGGNLEGRMRFMLEVAQRIRKEVGSEFPILVRLTADELMEGGNGLKEGKIMAGELEKAGVDLINPIPGWHESPVPLSQRDVAPGGFAYLSEEIRKVVYIPVAASNRIQRVELAEKILSEGKADLVTMARGLLADPELPRKAMDGKLEEIRHCIGCNQGCFDRVFRGLDVQCLVNPEAGREEEYKVKPAEKPRRILVVGGGPAGMESARIAALRGHHVTLCEKSDELGGLIRVASVPPYKTELENIIEYYSHQLSKVGVMVELKKDVTPELIEKMKPDVIIIATGSTPVIPDMPGIKQGNVVIANDVLAGRVEVEGKEVIVVGGGQVGIETAEFLAEKGKKITLVEMLNKLGRDLGPTVRWVVLARVARRGIKTLTKTKVEEIRGDNVISISDNKRVVFKADTIVISVGSKSDKRLADELRRVETGIEFYTIGDCVEPRNMLDAIHEAASVARKI